MDTETKRIDSVNIIYPKNVLNSELDIQYNQCFVVMSYANEYKPVYNKICNELKSPYSCVRVDRMKERGLIAADIIYCIKSSHFVIVDISSRSPNVFYELGLVHCFKNSSNVILIKRDDKKAPFDVNGYDVKTYSMRNLDGLVTMIREELEKKVPQQTLFNILLNKGIVTHEDNKYIDEGIFEDIKNELPNICAALSSSKVKIRNPKNILELVFSKIILNNERKASIYFQLFALLLVRFNVDINEEKGFKSILNEHSPIYHNIPESVIDSLQTDFVLTYANYAKPVSPIIDWIMKYFERSKSTNIDLNRHRLEKFLLQTTEIIAQNKIIEELSSKERHVREHMADIIGARRMQSAQDALIKQLAVEEWPFCASSIITALGRLEPNEESLNAIDNWFAQFKDSILEQRYHFILKRVVDSITALDKNGTLAREYHKNYDKTLIRYMNSHPILIRKQIKKVAKADNL